MYLTTEAQREEVKEEFFSKVFTGFEKNAGVNSYFY